LTTVLANPQIAPAAALAATFAWGLSDFVGGYASRRANAFLLTTITHVSGTTSMALLALRYHSALPDRQSLMWAMTAGLFGGVALAVFYRALSAGNMGLTAPVAAVLGAAIPTAFGIFTEGLPGPVPIAGFVLAGAGIWLISRPVGPAGRPEGIRMAVLAGIGFAGYFLCIKQAGNGSVFWLVSFSRLVSFFTTGAIVLAARQFKPMDLTGVAWGLGAGVVDSSGSALFILATQRGRLDTAVVISSLYPAVTVLLARLFLREHFSRWRFAGLLAALLAVPMIAWVAGS
jgi:drug/metabolite transporter (DMT)-like permease